MRLHFAICFISLLGTAGCSKKIYSVDLFANDPAGIPYNSLSVYVDNAGNSDLKSTLEYWDFKKQPRLQILVSERESIVYFRNRLSMEILGILRFDGDKVAYLETTGVNLLQFALGSDGGVRVIKYVKFDVSSREFPIDGLIAPSVKD